MPDIRSDDLFAEMPPTRPQALKFSQVLADKSPASKAHQAFHKLLQKVETKRAELGMWTEFAQRHQQRLMAEFLPLEREIISEKRRMVGFLDEVLRVGVPGRPLGRVQKAKLVDLLRSLLTELLEQGSDAELEAIHDQYAEVAFKQGQQDDMELAEALLNDIFGVELEADHGASTPEELLAHGQAKLRERAEAQARQAARKPKSSPAAQAKADKAQAASEQAAAEISQSLRDVYRKLASALHPDRETDERQRQRKTALMQRVNQAYEARDLLSLLGLQLEIEQIDAEHLGQVSVQRLAHYNEILREQLRELETELFHCQWPFREALAWDWHRNSKPEQVTQFFDRDLAGLRLTLQQLREDLIAWRDPKALRRFLAAYQIEPEDDFGFDDPFLLMEELMQAMTPPPQRRSRKR